MITLRLFEEAKPFQQIDEHPLLDAPIVIGRDPSADWVIDDANGRLSRKHCVLRRENGRIFLRDTSSNGVFIGPEKAPAPPEREFELKAGQSFHLGEYTVLVDGELDAEPVERLRPKPRAAATSSAAQVTDAGLLERFCIGAGLEPSSFAGEDPGDVMARLGAVYRQVVNDLSDLMQDRAVVKDLLQMDRTTVSARDNNPLKWAPPHRTAIELLQEGETGFLKGHEAFRASFADLRRHGAGLVHGSKSAIDFILAELHPDKLETTAKPQALAFISRNEAAWKRYRQVHAELLADARDVDGGKINHALRAGYEEHLATVAVQDDAA